MLPWICRNGNCKGVLNRPEWREGRYNGDISCDAKWHDQDVCNIMGTPSGLMIQTSFFHGTCCPNLGYTHIFGPSHMDIKSKKGGQKRWLRPPWQDGSLEQALEIVKKAGRGGSGELGSASGEENHCCRQDFDSVQLDDLRKQAGLWCEILWNPRIPAIIPKKSPKHHPPNFSKLENLKKEFEVENLHNIPEKCGKKFSKWLSFPPIFVRRGRYSALARRGGWALGQRLGTQGAGADAAGGLEHLGTWEV